MTNFSHINQSSNKSTYFKPKNPRGFFILEEPILLMTSKPSLEVAMPRSKNLANNREEECCIDGTINVKSDQPNITEINSDVKQDNYTLRQLVMESIPDEEELCMFTYMNVGVEDYKMNFDTLDGDWKTHQDNDMLHQVEELRPQQSCVHWRLETASPYKYRGCEHRILESRPLGPQSFGFPDSQDQTFFVANTVGITMLLPPHSTFGYPLIDSRPLPPSSPRQAYVHYNYQPNRIHTSLFLEEETRQDFLQTIHNEGYNTNLSVSEYSESFAEEQQLHQYMVHRSETYRASDENFLKQTKFHCMGNHEAGMSWLRKNHVYRCALCRRMSKWHVNGCRGK